MIQKLLKLSPVPVLFLPESKMSSQGEGWFCYSYADLWPAKYGFIIRFHPAYFLFKIFDWFLKRPRIEIRDDLSYHKKVSILLHEIGHALCYKKSCECYWKNRKYREIHAFEYTLNCMLKYKLKKEVQFEILWWIFLFSEQDDYYGEAARYIMKTELWRNFNFRICKEKKK